ncbi:MAG: hypothetical protein RML93_04370 [Anaerolineales bacterium]|nr:hypothetical protein [Anaerolineales bacterium]MCS7247884.1 hypothetical protein [Anaerolineales bacterium]MDW8161694.1 hypothetical protein [Anaerolineales bacterium]MDW8446512.1 hypothetical protein [Anaerolineales bacterium]
MKDSIRQAAVVLSIFATLVVNGLANALPLNGLTTGGISDRFRVYFVPAGYVFSIWGLIYLGLIAFAVFQALPAQRENPRLRAIGGWVVLGNIANSAWIFLWHYELFPLTLVAMLVLLLSLIQTYLKLDIGRRKVEWTENLFVHLPFRIYLGWITVATVANVTTVLDYLRWDGFGIAPEIWMSLVLIAVAGIAGAVNLTRHDLAYTLVILWALAGIAVKHAAVSAVVIPTWVTFALVSSSLLFSYVRKPARLVENVP